MVKIEFQTCLYFLKIEIPLSRRWMEELQVNMLGSPHSNGLAAALLSKMAFLCAACWCRAARGVFGGSYPPWVRRSAHCKPPTQSSRATGGGEWLPPVAPPVCHQHPSHPQGLGQHKQTTSWAGRSQFGFHLGGKE